MQLPSFSISPLWPPSLWRTQKKRTMWVTLAVLALLFSSWIGHCFTPFYSFSTHHQAPLPTRATRPGLCQGRVRWRKQRLTRSHIGLHARAPGSLSDEITLSLLIHRLKVHQVPWRRISLTQVEIHSAALIESWPSPEQPRPHQNASQNETDML